MIQDNTNDLLELNNLGVQITICNNSLENFNISKDVLLDFLNIVPVGVLQLATKQADGYSYIKS